MDPSPLINQKSIHTKRERKRTLSFDNKVFMKQKYELPDSII